MKEKVLEHIETLFNNYEELVETVDEALLSKGLDVPMNKTLAEHVWCVLGARESYARALVVGEWQGFTPPITKEEAIQKDVVLEQLKASVQVVRDSINEIAEWTPERDELLLNLLEHETMHEGQIIRLVYGLEEKLPQSWVDRWA